MAYTMYTPLNVWLEPASVTDVVAYIQNYLSENTIYSEEEIETLIHDYLIAHPELIGGVQSVNGKTGTVVLTASDINTTNNTTIQAVINSLSADIASIVQSVTTLSGRVTSNETGITNEATARANADTALGNRITALQGAVGSPLIADTASAMTDTRKIYVYTGSETGYTNGNWYYYNGSAWVSGGVYNSVAINTDTTLTVAGMAADAKATGDELNALKSSLTEFEQGNILMDSELLIGWYIGYGDSKLYQGSDQATMKINVENYTTLEVTFDGGNKKRLGFSNDDAVSRMTLNDYTTSSTTTTTVTNNGYKYLYVMFTDNYASTGGTVSATSVQDYYATVDNLDDAKGRIDDNLTFTDGYYSNTLYYNSSNAYKTTEVIEVKSGELLDVYAWGYIGAVSMITECNSSGTALSILALSNSSGNVPTHYYFNNPTVSSIYVKVSVNVSRGYRIYKTYVGLPQITDAKNVLFMGDSITCLRDYPSLIKNNNNNINVGVPGATFVRYTDSENKGVSFYDYITAMVNDDTALQSEIISRYDDQRAVNCIQRFIDLDFSTIDVIVIWYGMNDYLRNKELGTATETDYSKVIPCVEYGLNMLSTHFPTVNIYCIGNSYTDKTNTLGLTPTDYADAVKEVCEKYAVPFYDMYHLGAVNSTNYESRLEDGIHPNAYQNEVNAQKIGNFIKT